MHSTSVEDARPPPPVIPPSPTLSNPDMILPFDQNERESSTPSPPFNLPSLSHLQSFYENRPIPNDYGVDPRNAAQMGAGWRQKGYPRHTWLNEGHDAASRRLSDIGEEDTPTYFGGFAKKMHMPHGARFASPAVLQHPESADARDTGAWSSSSSSTISGASESPMDSGAHRQIGQNTRQEDTTAGNFPSEAVRATQSGAQDESARLSIISTTSEGGPADGMSSAVLSNEAERILENAKKRLTLMEGNLTRARSSMRMSPSLSASPTPSIGSQTMGLGQPVGGLYQSISRADRRSSVLRPRATYNTSQDTTNNRHSRVYSETHIPSEQSTLAGAGSGLSRSMSAMGSSSTSNFNNDDRSFRYDQSRAYLTHRASVSSMQRPRRVSPPYVKDQAQDAPHGLGISTEDKENRISSIDEFNSTYPQQDPLSRSQSQLHVRDLQDQMKGLHIKISSLKVKTQEDNLRRRSLQSLRTPSPFTAADQYYTNGMELKDANRPTLSRESSHQESLRQASRQNSQRMSSSVSKERTLGHSSSGESITKSPSSGNASQPVDSTNDNDDDGQSIMESLYEDAEEGDYYNDVSYGSDIDREALNEILNEPLDEDLQDPLEYFPAVPHRPDDTPHEERADAFDYEHFILHSALGNFTQSRARRESNASDTSVETTRPAQGHRSSRHSRANSGASVSTVATFATAAEENDEIDSVLYWDRKFNDEIHHRYPDYDDDEVQGESEPESMGTPRAARKQPSRQSRMGKHRVETNSAFQRPESAMTGSATPTSLVSSLVSTVRAASSPHPNSVDKGNMGINDDDTRLLEHLFQSLGDVCMELQAITTSPEPDPQKARLLRRRLDAARRVLDGELDT